jgi:hypothetical protein
MPALDTTQLLAIAAALGWASGLRLYAVVFLTGLSGVGWIDLPTGPKVPRFDARRERLHVVHRVLRRQDSGLDTL